MESIRIMVVVTNQGTIHYLCKDKEYNYRILDCFIIKSRGGKMSEYMLNDIKFNPAPLTLCPAGQGDNTDEAELKKIFQKNKELAERLERQFNERKMSGQRIV